MRCVAIQYILYFFVRLRTVRAFRFHYVDLHGSTVILVQLFVFLVTTSAPLRFFYDENGLNEARKAAHSSFTRSSSGYIIESPFMKPSGNGTGSVHWIYKLISYREVFIIHI